MHPTHVLRSLWGPVRRKNDKIQSSRSSLASSDSTFSGNNEPRPEPIDPHDIESLRRTSSSLALWSVYTVPQKRFIVFMVALASFFSPLSANIYFPALNTLSADFGVSPGIMNLTLTSYMIFQGLAPTIFGDFADMAGRRPAYIIGFTIYIGACIGIASCNTFPALLILRCMQSTIQPTWLGEVLECRTARYSACTCSQYY